MERNDSRDVLESSISVLVKNVVWRPAVIKLWVFVKTYYLLRCSFWCEQNQVKFFCFLFCDGVFFRPCILILLLFTMAKFLNTCECKSNRYIFFSLAHENTLPINGIKLSLRWILSSMLSYSISCSVLHECTIILIVTLELFKKRRQSKNFAIGGRAFP